MTNLPVILAGSGKIKTELAALRMRSDVIKSNQAPDVFVSNTTRGTFISPKRSTRGIKNGVKSSSARWL